MVSRAKFPHYKEHIRLIELKNDPELIDDNDYQHDGLPEDVWVYFDDVYEWVKANWTSGERPTKTAIQRDLMRVELVKSYKCIDIDGQYHVPVVRVSAFIKYLLQNRFKEPVFNDTVKYMMNKILNIQMKNMKYLEVKQKYEST